MDKIIGVTELQRNFRNVLDDVVEQKASYILTRGSRPEAVLISYERYHQFVAGHSDDVLARIERLIARMESQNAPYGETDVEADLKQATRELREAKRA